jgi:hypothetical protein
MNRLNDQSIEQALTISLTLKARGLPSDRALYHAESTHSLKMHLYVHQGINAIIIR